MDFSVHYNIHYITFTILVRETWNDYQKSIVVIRGHSCVLLDKI